MAKSAAPCTVPRPGSDYCKRAGTGRSGLSGPGQVRVNKAGCLDRCSAAPVLVIIPEAVWYTFIDEERHRQSSSRT